MSRAPSGSGSIAPNSVHSWARQSGCDQPPRLEAVGSDLLLWTARICGLLGTGEGSLVGPVGVDLDGAEQAGRLAIDREHRELLDFAVVVAFGPTPGPDHGGPGHAGPHDPLHL